MSDRDEQPFTVHVSIRAVLDPGQSYELGEADLTEDNHMQQVSAVLRRIADEIDRGEHDPEVTDG